MKKKILILFFVVVFGLVITGCGSNKEKEDDKMTGGWEIVLSDNQIEMDEELLKIFNDAKENYTSMILDPVALLGEQVVAGTNYMFLAKGYQSGEEATYKIVVIYNDLENKSTITSVSDFDYTKYVNENIESNFENLAGGWYVNAPGKLNVLDSEVQDIFDNATSTLTGMMYNPIAVLGKQIVSGTNYAIICYGRASYEGMSDAIYLITLYEDLNGNDEIVSHAYIDISEYNN